MTGIVTALKTHHSAGLVSQQINNFALALVSPLWCRGPLRFCSLMYNSLVCRSIFKRLCPPLASELDEFAVAARVQVGREAVDHNLTSLA